MSMLMSSCTLMSLAPGKFSPATLQLRTKQSAASASALLALPRASPRVSRALRLVCHAYDAYDILPNVGDHGDWKINQDKHHITLAFDVGEGTKEDNLSVTTKYDNQELWLEIKYKGDKNDKSQATSLNVRLQMPQGYEEKNVMKAELLPDGWLQIIIAKPKQKTGPNKVDGEPKNLMQPAAKTDEKKSS